MNPTADIEIKYVNPPKPGKKFGNVKDVEGGLWLVDPAKLNQFSPGMKCKVEYTSRTGQDGTEWRTVGKIIGNGAGPTMPAQNFRQRSNPAEAKQIAVLAIVKEWVPQIPVGDEAALVSAIGAAMRAYDKTLGGTQSQRRDDMDDEINF